MGLPMLNIKKAKLSPPNLAIVQHYSQQLKIRCKLAGNLLATYIGYLVFDELPTEPRQNQISLYATLNYLTTR